MVSRIGTSQPEVTPLYSNGCCPQAPDNPQEHWPRIVIRTPACVPSGYSFHVPFSFPSAAFSRFHLHAFYFQPCVSAGRGSQSVAWISSPSSTTLNRMVLGILLPNTKFPGCTQWAFHCRVRGCSTWGWLPMTRSAPASIYWQPWPSGNPLVLSPFHAPVDVDHQVIALWPVAVFMASTSPADRSVENHQDAPVPPP